MTFLAGHHRVLELVATGAPLNDVLTLVTQVIEAEDPGLRCAVWLVDESGIHLRAGAGRSPQDGLCTPILDSQGQALGYFAMVRRQSEDARPYDREIARVASRLASIAIEHQSVLVDTRRKQAKQAHAVTANQLAEIIELAPAFMTIFRGPTLIIEMANDAYRQLVGERELIGLPVREAFPDIDGQGFFELVESVYISGEPWVGRSVPVMLNRQPGEPAQVRWIDLVYQALREADGSISGVFAHGVDITERKLAEQALHETALQADRRAKLFDTTLSAMTEFGYLIDAQGRLTFVNKALLNLWGLPLDEVVGKNFFDLGYPDALAPATCQVS